MKNIDELEAIKSELEIKYKQLDLASRRKMPRTTRPEIRKRIQESKAKNMVRRDKVHFQLLRLTAEIIVVKTLKEEKMEKMEKMEIKTT